MAADSAGTSGPAAASALTLLAFAERRWATVAELAGAARNGRLEGDAVGMALCATALARMGKAREALTAAHTARHDAEPYGPSIRALALLAEARAWAEAEPSPAEGHADKLLIRARQLADSVGSAELVASIDKERGLQALSSGQPALSIEPLESACLHWLGTGITGALTGAVDALEKSLTRTGQPETARRILSAYRTGKTDRPDASVGHPRMRAGAAWQSAAPTVGS